MRVFRNWSHFEDDITEKWAMRYKGYWIQKKPSTPAIVVGSCYGSGAGALPSFVGVSRSTPAGTTDLKPEHGIDYASLFDL